MYKLSARSVVIVLLHGLITYSVRCDYLFIDLNPNASNYKELPRFWTNSGFSPSAPLPFNRTCVAAELQSDDVFWNIEYVSAMPNMAVKHIRIHWLLSLVEFKGLGVKNIPEYNFKALDHFLDRLDKVRLLPIIEFMGNIFPKQKRHDTRYMWKDFTYQLVSRYLMRYGPHKLSEWRFELWNEPDLETYNILDFTLHGYMEYVIGVSEGLKAASRRTNPEIHFQLHGPSGLFKSIDKHPLCWGLLDKCNSNMTQCPIDAVSFHRKGLSDPSDIVTNTERLITELHQLFPNTVNMPYTNTECDPFAGWSANVSSNANVFYAHTLASIVFDHWRSISSGRLKNLEFISHDNSFLSYHPYEFEQRTMLARFAMNNTIPKTVHFIQKPVYAALGLLGSLAPYATRVHITHNIRYLITQSKHYVAALLLSEHASRTDRIKLRFNVKFYRTNESRTKFAYFAEYLHQNQVDPYSVWMRYGSPPYPNVTVLDHMHHAQGPHILRNPKLIDGNQTHIGLNIKMHHPWLILVRVCSNVHPQPAKVENLRIRNVDKYTILLFWHDNANAPMERCIKTYEIFYTPNDGSADRSSDELEWTSITQHKHVPFLSYCHGIENANFTSVEGFYKVRAVDLFGRYGDFSDTYEYKFST